MKIDCLELNNYRCFETLSIHLHPEMTVLVAPNGQGKTAILDAIKVALWPFVSGFDLGSTTNDVTGIAIDDVFRTQTQAHQMEWRLPTQVQARGRFKGNEWKTTRQRTAIKKGSKTKDVVLPYTYTRHVGQPPPNDGVYPKFLKNHLPVPFPPSLSDIAKTLQQGVFSDQNDAPPDDLPLLAYYGTGRLWAQKKLTATHTQVDTESLSRTFAYRDCLDPASSYKHFAAWFSRVHQAYLQAQIRSIEKGQPSFAAIPEGLAAPYKAIQQATDTLLKPHTGWHSLAYSFEHEELTLEHDEYGQLKASQLSDGIRNVLALVGDLAYRCYKLNAHLGARAPVLTQGIVLIDEVDMHLHPRWQQTILTDLSAAFPQLQFIVTTHSPQVLSSVDKACIRLLERDPKGIWEALEPSQEVKGIESGVALNDVMHTNPVPPNEEAQWWADYTAKIETHTHEDPDGLALRAKLLAFYGPQHPDVLNADRLIRFQAFKLRQASKKPQEQ